MSAARVHLFDTTLRDGAQTTGVDFSLDDKRTELDGTEHENNNIPDILARWTNREAEKDRARTDQSFLVPKADIADNDYDLSINRYKEVVYEEVVHESPQEILRQLTELEK